MSKTIVVSALIERDKHGWHWARFVGEEQIDSAIEPTLIVALYNAIEPVLIEGADLGVVTIKGQAWGAKKVLGKIKEMIEGDPFGGLDHVQARVEELLGAL